MPTRASDSLRQLARKPSAASVAVPMLVIAGDRIATTPDLMPTWRNSLLTVDIPHPRTNRYGRLVDYNHISPDVATHAGVSTRFLQDSTAEQQVLLQQELDSDNIGDYVSMTDMDAAVTLNRDIRIGAVRVLLKWARQVRESAAAGGSCCRAGRSS